MIALLCTCQRSVPVQVAVFTSRKGFEKDLRPVLAANPYLKVEFLRPGSSLTPPPDVSIYDSATPPAEPAANSIYFVRGKGKFAAAHSSYRLEPAARGHAMGAYPRRQRAKCRSTRCSNGRCRACVGRRDSSRAAVVVARDQNRRRSLIIGFDPHDSNFPEQSAFPLLVAGSVEWMTHPIEDVSDSLSAGELDLPGPAVRVIGPGGAEVPFGRNGSNLHIIALDTGLYRVIGPNRNSHLCGEHTATFVLAADRADGVGAVGGASRSDSLPGKLFVAGVGHPGDCCPLGGVVAVLLGAHQPAGRTGAEDVSG